MTADHDEPPFPAASEPQQAAPAAVGDGRRRSRRLVWRVLLACLAAAQVLSWAGSGPCDDDYIVYRYARNLAEGLGPVFNPGERVEGFTVPLWMLLHAAGSALGLAPERLSLALGALGAALATWAVAAVWQRRVRARSFPAPALLVALSPALGLHGALGLGTALLAGLVAAWFAAVDAGRPRRAALWLAPAALLRPEAALFALVWFAWPPRDPAAVHADARQPAGVRASRGWALVSLVPLAAWVLFRLGTYGAWLPQSFHTKRLPLAVDLRYGLAYLGRSTLEVGAGLWLVLALAGARRKPGDAVFRLGAAALLLHALYVLAVGGDYMPLARFAVPVLPLGYLLACLAARERIHPLRRGTVLVVVLLLVSWPQLERDVVRGMHEFNERRWLAVGDALGATAAPGSSLALAPIGAIGFRSGLPIVDLLGVVEPSVAAAAPNLEVDMKGHHRHDADAVLAREPDLIVLGNAVRMPDGTLVISRWERDLFLHEAFRADYEERELDVPGSYPLTFYLRRGARAPRGARKPPR